MTELMSDTGRETLLQPLLDAGWAHDAERDAITKEYRFDTFIAAFGWMSQVALYAEKWDHHPEWFNVYNRVDVLLATHDADGVTTLDLELARFMDSIAPV